MVTASQKSWMRFLNAVSVVLGSVGVCGRAAALGGATRSAAGLGGGFGEGFDVGVGGFDVGFGMATVAGRADWVARGATDVVGLAPGAFPVAAQPARAPAASRAKTGSHLTDEEHTPIGDACTLRYRAADDPEAQARSAFYQF